MHVCERERKRKRERNSKEIERERERDGRRACWCKCMGGCGWERRREGGRESAGREAAEGACVVRELSFRFFARKHKATGIEPVGMRDKTDLAESGLISYIDMWVYM